MLKTQKLSSQTRDVLVVLSFGNSDFNIVSNLGFRDSILYSIGLHKNVAKKFLLICNTRGNP